MRNNLGKNNSSVLYIALIALLFLFNFGVELSSQSISFDKVSTNSICNESTVSFSLLNDAGSDLEVSDLTLQLPCGFEYLPGSIVGLIEEDISDLQAPIFKVASLTIGQELPISILASTSCEIVLCLNANADLDVNARWSSSSFNVNKTSLPFNFEIPNLVFTNISNLFIELINQSEFERIIKIKNTRLGDLTSFYFKESYNSPDYLIALNIGQILNQSVTATEYNFDGDDFKLFGDGDDLFEFNEEITIIEKVIITSCPYDIKNLKTTLSLSWGCDVEICQEASKNANIKFKPTVLEGQVLEAVGNAIKPSCYFNAKSTQKLTLTNISGYSSLSNIDLVISANDVFLGIEEGSINIDIDASRYQITYAPLNTESCLPNASRATINFTNVERNETINIDWIGTFCDDEQCDDVSYDWRINASYLKDCASPIEVKQTLTYGFSIVENFGVAETFLMISPSGPVNDEDILHCEFNFNSKALLTNGNITNIEILAPCGFTYIDQDYIINGTSPLSVTYVDVDSGSIVSIIYDKPFQNQENILEFDIKLDCEIPCDKFNCENEFLGTCPMACKNGGAPEEIKVKLTIKVDTNCDPSPSIKEFTKTPILINCQKGVCIDSLPGWVGHTTEIFRRSRGLTDIDDNGLADDSNLAASDVIQHNHIIIGDTFDISLAGEIHIDFDNARAKKLFLEYELKYEGISPLGGGVTGPVEFGNMVEFGGLKELNTKVVVKRGSSQTFVLTGLKLTTMPRSTSSYLDLNVDSLISLGLVLPDFKWQEGDSIFVNTTHQLMYNIASSRFFDFEPSVLDISLKSNFGFHDEAIAPPEVEFFSTQCACENLPISIGGIQFSDSEYGLYDYFNRMLCPGDQREFLRFPTGFGVRKGFFPNEYRSIYYPSELRIIKFDYFKVSSISLRIRNRFNSIIYNELITDFVDNGSYSSFKIPYFELDEYCRFDWQYTIETTDELACTTTSFTTRHDVIVDYLLKQEFPFNPLMDLEYVLTTAINYQVSYPNIKLEFDKTVSESFSDTLSWDFTYINSNEDVEVTYPYLHFEDNPTIDKIIVTNLGNGDIYTTTSNGYVILPDIADSLRLNIKAILSSCKQEQLKINYGWDCDIWNGIGTPPCIEKNVTIAGSSPPPVSEIRIEVDPHVAPLCEAYDFIEVDFINAGLGNLYNPKIYAELPQFLNYIDGSSEVFDNSIGAYVPIVAIVNGNILTWDISSFVDEFIPPEQQQPLNTYKIRYKVKADCGYASGSTIRHFMEGNLVCGRKTNGVSKVTGPISIEGLISESLIDLGGDVISTNCNGELLIRVDVDKQTAFEPGILNVTIPFGGILISSSTSLPLIVSGNKLTYELPITLYQESFEILLKLDSSLICVDGQLDINSSVVRNADCQSQSCQVEVIVNNFIIPYKFDTPDYDIQSFTIGGSSDGYYDFEININKLGGLDDEILIYKLVLDDGDGIFNGDSIILTDQTNVIIGDNQFEVAGIQMSFEDLCNLMIVIDSDLNCICIPVAQSLNKIKVIEEYQSVCQGDSINLGVTPINNAAYNWNPAQGISCISCPQNNIFIGSSEDELLYNLAINFASGCEIIIDYPVLVNPLPMITNPNISACAGDTILVISNADSVLFSGPDIINQSGNTLTIVTKESGIYIGMLTDINGCSNIDTAYITTLPNPEITTEDYMFCYGQQGQITVGGSDSLQYNWTNGLNRLEDVFNQNTSILIQETYDYLLLVSNGACTIIDTVSVVYFDGLDIDFMQDSIDVCLNGEVEIQLPEGYDYQWSLEEYITCLNNECSLVNYSNSGGQDNFTIIASDIEGCKDTISLSIRTLTGSMEMEDVFFCVGDSVLHGSDYVFTEQTICDTTTAECEFIACVNYRYFSGNYFDFYEDEIERGDSIDLEIDNDFMLYQWTSDPTLSCLDCPVPNAKPLVTTTYELLAYDDNNCPVVIRYNIIVNTQCSPEDVLIPNAFTPDGNGENDVFKVANLAINDPNVQSFSIFNEWGMELLNINSNAGWDGYYNGDLAAPGTYVYIIKIDCGTGVEKFVGSITLIR